MNNDAEVSQFLPLVRSISHKMFQRIRFAHPSIDEGDILAMGAIGLLQGLQAFDQTKNPNKKQFLSYRIVFAIREGVKSWNRSLTHLPIKQREGRESEIFFDDLCPAFEPVSDHPDQHDEYIKARLHDELLNLPDRLKRVLEMRYIQGLGFFEIGEQIGVSKQRAAQVAKLGIERLRVQFKENNFSRASRECKNRTKQIF
jgi:RNA polymerase sigma factor (sigma-70 family)